MEIENGKLIYTDEDLKALEKEGFGVTDRNYLRQLAVIGFSVKSNIDLSISIDSMAIVWLEGRCVYTSDYNEPEYQNTQYLEIDTQEKLEAVLNYMRLFI